MAFKPWPGGRVREVNGARVWYIRKRLGDGARAEFALDVTTEKEALAEYALFLRDPAGYRTPKQRAAVAHQTAGGPVRLDGETLDAFLEYCRARVARGELTADYVRQTLAPYLTAWGKALGGKDLHRVDLELLRATLKRWT